MTHSLTLQINPENLKRLNKNGTKHLSLAQQNIMEMIKNTLDGLSKLREQESFKFTKDNEFEVSRGNFFAITKSLQGKIAQNRKQQEALSTEPEQEKISLEDLDKTLKDDLSIENERDRSFIISCLVEPIWLPGTLSVIANATLFDTSYLCNNHSQSEPLKTIGTENNINFQFNLNIQTNNTEEPLDRGVVTVDFNICNTRRVELLPISMQFTFPNKKEFKQFKKDLCRNFQDWIFWPKTHWQITDLWVIPILLGCLAGIIAMMGLLALSLTPISPLLLPPLGFALGLGLASVMHSYVHISIKKEKKKLQRPIYLSTHPTTQTQSLFNLRNSNVNQSNRHEHKSSDPPPSRSMSAMPSQ